MPDVIVRPTRWSPPANSAGGTRVFADDAVEIRMTSDVADQVAVDERTVRVVVGHVSPSTESLLSAGAEKADDCDGRFVLVEYDRLSREVLIVHDKAGFGHAYYWSDGRDFAASTDLGHLMAALPKGVGRLDRRGLALYLCFQYVPAPYTIVDGVSQLEPGTRLQVGPATGPRITRSCAFPHPLRAQTTESLADNAAAVWDLVTQAAAEQLSAGASVGAMLSGGMDTSTNVALLVERLGVRPLALTASFDESFYDETGSANAVARQFGLDHVPVAILPGMIESLTEIVRAFDTPNADQAIFAEYFVCRAARDHGCSQLVTGEGGDEVLGLPQSHRDDIDFQHLPQGPQALSRLYFHRTFLADPALLAELLGNMDVDPALPYDYLQDLYSGSLDRSPFDRLYLGQWRTWLIDGVYMKDSRTLAHFGLSPVFPFMDTRLMSYMAQLPQQVKIDGLADKKLLRIAGGHLLPREILEKKKHKFWLPMADWLRQDAQELLWDTLLRSDGAITAYCGPRLVKRLLGEHQQRRADHSRILWAFLFLETWVQEQWKSWL